MELVVALVIAPVVVLAKLAAAKRQESAHATFVKVGIRTYSATGMHARRRAYEMREFRGVAKTPNPSVIDRIYG